MAKMERPIITRKCYLGYDIPANPKMSHLIKLYTEKHKSWPKRILDKYQKKLINKKIWSQTTFVKPDATGYPLAERYL